MKLSVGIRKACVVDCQVFTTARPLENILLVFSVDISTLQCASKILRWGEKHKQSLPSDGNRLAWLDIPRVCTYCPVTAQLFLLVKYKSHGYSEGPRSKNHIRRVSLHTRDHEILLSLVGAEGRIENQKSNSSPSKLLLKKTTQPANYFGCWQKEHPYWGGAVHVRVRYKLRCEFGALRRKIIRRNFWGKLSNCNIRIHIWVNSVHIDITDSYFRSILGGIWPNRFCLPKGPNLFAGTFGARASFMCPFCWARDTKTCTRQPARLTNVHLITY